MGATAQTNEAAEERERCREVFRSAYGRYLGMKHRSMMHVQNIEHVSTGGGIGHLDPILWVRDFELAAMATLSGVEMQIFEFRYIKEFTRTDTMRAVGFRSGSSWYDHIGQLEERVGVELERREIWPMSAYVTNRLNEDIANVLYEETGQRHYAKVIRHPGMDNQ